MLYHSTPNGIVSRILRRRADASAEITGSESFPLIKGRVDLYQLKESVLLTAWVTGFPEQTDEDASVFGFHIHEGESCTGNENDPFADALTHYNPNGTEHPRHAGDLPPLFAYRGEAYLCFLTEGFTVAQVVSKAVIIHSDRDDFTTQPAGNAGTKIACGIIHNN